MARIERYTWSAPISVEAEVAPTAGQTGWTSVASLDAGHWSHAELWFSGHPAYTARPWRILGRIGSIWAVLAAGNVGAPPLLQPNALQLTGILGKLRGQPCEALTAQIANAAGAQLPPAIWRLHAWGEDCCPQPDAAGNLPVDVVTMPPVVVTVVPSIWMPVHDPHPSHAVYVASLVPCLINCAFARNDGDSVRWFQVHDVALGLGLGAVPIEPGLRVQPGCSVSQSYDSARLLVGCWLASSLTAKDYTPDTDRAGLDMGALIQ